MRPDLAEQDFGAGLRAALARRRVGFVTIMSCDQKRNRARRYMVDDNGTMRCLDHDGVVALAGRPIHERSQHHREDHRDLDILVLDEPLLAMEDERPPDGREVARALHQEARALSRRGEHGAAERALARSLVIFEAAFGPADVEVALTLELLGRALADQGRTTLAILMHGLAITIRETANDRPADIAFSRFLRARAVWRAGCRADAIEIARAARYALGARATRQTKEINQWLASHDHKCKTCELPYSPKEEKNSRSGDHYPPHRYADGSEDHCLPCWLGVGPRDRGRIEAEIEQESERRGIVIGDENTSMSEAADRPDSPELARTLLDNARALLHTEQHAEVRQLLLRCVAMFETTLGSSHLELALPLDLLGHTLVSLGDAEAAVGLHRRAIAIRESHDARSANVVYSRFLLGRAMWDAGHAGLDRRASARGGGRSDDE